MSSKLASYSEPFQEWFLCMILCWIHTGNSEIRFLTVQGSILLCRSDMLTYNTRKLFFFFITYGKVCILFKYPETAGLDVFYVFVDLREIGHVFEGRIETKDDS